MDYIISRLQSQIGDYDLTKLQLMSTWRGAIGSRSIRSSRFGWPCCTDMCMIKCKNILQYFAFQKMKNSIWIFVILEYWTLYSLYCHHNQIYKFTSWKGLIVYSWNQPERMCHLQCHFRGLLEPGSQKVPASDKIWEEGNFHSVCTSTKKFASVIIDSRPMSSLPFIFSSTWKLAVVQ